MPALRARVGEEAADALVEREQVAKARLDDGKQVLPVLWLEALGLARVEGAERLLGLLLVGAQVEEAHLLLGAAHTQPYEEPASTGADTSF